MKKFVYLILSIFLLVSFLESSYVGKAYFKPWPSEPNHKVFLVPKRILKSSSINVRVIGKGKLNPRVDKATNQTYEDQLMELEAYFQSETKKGNLRIRLVQDDPEAMMEHRRYTQYYKDLEVFGGEIIKHLKQGRLVGINGEYYEIDDLETTPLLTKEIAVDLLKSDLGKFNLTERAEESKLIIYPIKDRDYRLAYRLVLEDGEIYSMTGIMSAKTGEVLLKYSNIQNDDLTIGIGIGYHGDTYKFPATLSNDAYWLYDEGSTRPVNQYTYNVLPGYFETDSDNYWDWDGVLVNVHAYEGYAYDYYYLMHGRKGLDNNNMDIEAVVHYLFESDSAYWHPYYMRMYFCDPYYTTMQTGAGLDAVAHEYTHGVTQFSSNLQYENQSGSLNESFSDIMAAATEFYWQQEGNGFNKADWLIGEDLYPTYGYFLRSLSNPNSKVDLLGPDPCHLSQFYALPNTEAGDWGGVHKNSTIYSHAYYLLSVGGTNLVSLKSVSGIGLEKATKIFYLAWIHWMTPTSNFWNAANYLLWSAAELYGSSSNEYAQTVKAMEAIGWIVE